MSRRTGRDRGRLAASAVAVLLAAAGAGAIATGLGGVAAPWDLPSASTTADGGTPASTASPSPDGTPARTEEPSPAEMPPSPADVPPTAPPAAANQALPASVPVRLDVPALGISTPLIRLGKEPDGEVQVPPGEPGSPAGWYTGSASPGQNGSAVILGHVNAIGTPIGVFYRLHELAPGQQVSVVRADGTAAVFAVDRVTAYPKAAFPTIEVYRNADRPEIRLITCSGYEPASGQYVDNVVVYAHLVSTHPA